MRNLIQQLREHGYDDLPDRIEAMEKFYNNDSLTYCEKVRPILALLLTEIENIVEVDNSSIQNYRCRIVALYRKRNRLIDGKLYNELQILRTLGNKYAHQDQKKITPEQDKKTIKTSICCIVERLLKLSTEYEEWKKENQSRNQGCFVGTIFVAVLGAIVAIVFALIGKNK